MSYNPNKHTLVSFIFKNVMRIRNAKCIYDPHFVLKAASNK